MRANNGPNQALPATRANPASTWVVSRASSRSTSGAALASAPSSESYSPSTTCSSSLTRTGTWTRRNCTARTSPVTTTSRGCTWSTSLVRASATAPAFCCQRFSARCWKRRCDQPPDADRVTCSSSPSTRTSRSGPVGMTASSSAPSRSVGRHHHHIGELALPPGQQRRNVGQYPAAGHIPRRGVR